MPTKRQDTTTSPKAYQLKVTLAGIRPPIWRRVLVESGITLESFHHVLQAVMGWTDSHMHEFRTLARRVGLPRQVEAIPGNEEHHTLLGEILRRPKDRIVYEYDFGDGWEHEVLLEGIEDPAARARARYPWIMDGRRACPPDDVGGTPGYDRFLRIIADPGHPEHEEMREWCGGSFDPDAFDVQALNRAFHGGWGPKKPKKLDR